MQDKGRQQVIRMSNLLEITGLHVAYGDVPVLWDISLKVASGQIVALIGSNGVGKSTLINTISGLVPVKQGQITFDGRPLNPVPAPDRVRRGIVQVPEGRKLFPQLTVRNNLLQGAFVRRDTVEIRRDMDWIQELLPELVPLMDQPAGSLSGGQQQMVAIGRGLMGRPRLLMVDELSLGLAPVVVDRLVDLLRHINRESGVTILLVEQDVQVALELAQSGLVIQHGRVAFAGESKELLNDPRVREAYLGL